MKLTDQIRAHSIGIIGLLTAIVGFSYNTLQTDWIEKNATRRDATFQVLLALGTLQEIVHYAHFVEGRSKAEKSLEEDRGNPISGWSQMLLIKDLSVLVRSDDEDAMVDLFNIWQEYFASLDDPAVEQKVSAAILRSREACVEVLMSLW